MNKSISFSLLILISSFQTESINAMQGCYIKGMAGKQPEKVCFLKRFYQHMELYGTDHPRVAVMFFGVSGLGKSVGAKKFAEEIDATFVRIETRHLPEYDKPGKGAYKVRKIYEEAVETAKKTGKPVVLCFDEVADICKPGKKDIETENVITELKLQITAHKNNPNILTIITYNTTTASFHEATEALLSRLDTIEWVLPDLEKRTELIKYYTQKYNMNFTDEQYANFAYYMGNFSCKHIEDLMNDLNSKKIDGSIKEITEQDVYDAIAALRNSPNTTIAPDYGWYDPRRLPSDVKEVTRGIIKGGIIAGGTWGLGTALKKGTEAALQNEKVQAALKKIWDNLPSLAGGKPAAA